MTQINPNQVKSRLVYFARRVKAGETLILCDRNKPFAETRSLGIPGRPRPKRELGLMKGWFPVPENFNEPDPEMEDAIESGPIFPRLPGLKPLPSSSTPGSFGSSGKTLSDHTHPS